MGMGVPTETMTDESWLALPSAGAGDHLAPEAVRG